MGVDLSDLVPPHLNPPPPWGEENIFGSIGVVNKSYRLLWKGRTAKVQLSQGSGAIFPIFSTGREEGESACIQRWPL